MANCVVLYNNLTVGNEKYRERISDITNFFAQTPSFDHYTTSTLTDTLSILANQGYEWAIVNAVGHGVDDADIYNDAVVECQRNNWPMMAHIISQQGIYPGLDPQFIVLNLSIWKQLGKPAFELGRLSFDTTTVEQSTEHVHGDYTPMWVRAGGGNRTYTVYKFGSEVIRSFVEMGYTVGNFNADLRKRKWHLYPEHNQLQLEKLFFENVVTYDEVPDIVKRIMREHNTLSSTVYVLNSEPVNPFTSFKVDHVIGVASGLKTVLMLNQLEFSDATHITYADISTAALDYQQYLIANWDGDVAQYHTVCQTYQTQNSGYRYAWREWNTWDSEIANMLSNANITAQEFKSLWQRYCSLTHHFLTVDLLDDPSKLIAHISAMPGDNVYVWVSNAYDMQWSRFLVGSSTLKQKFKSFVSQLRELKVRGYVESAGVFYKLAA
jgi:hypothetical protein